MSEDLASGIRIEYVLVPENRDLTTPHNELSHDDDAGDDTDRSHH